MGSQGNAGITAISAPSRTWLRLLFCAVFVSAGCSSGGSSDVQGDADAATTAGADSEGSPPKRVDGAACKVHKGDVGAEGVVDLEALAGVCTIEGDVFLTGGAGNPLNEAALAQLVNLRVIEGSLIIEDIAAAGLEGLSHLERIDGDLNITANHYLQRLDGLAALHTIGHDFILRDNDALVAIDTPKLKTIASGLLVQANPSLTSLSGLDAVAALDNTVRIVGNQALLGLQGLEGLRIIGAGGLVVAENQRLLSVAPLERLERCGDLLQIRDNRDLVKVSGIFELRAARRVAIQGNANLTAIDGFPKLNETERIEIFDNSALVVINGFSAAAELLALTVRDNPSLAKLVAFGGTVDSGALTIRDNDTLTQISLAKLNHVGTLTLERNGSLANLSGFFPTKYVDILHICDNAKLPKFAVDTFLKQLYKPPMTVDDCTSP